MRTLCDAIRMAVGTLTALPVPAPNRVDRRVAGGAMLLAPVAALPLAALSALVVLGGELARLPALLTAALTIGAVALSSRGLHLDGLADTADGLSVAGRSDPHTRARALEVMRRGDVGPSGAAALALMLLAQSAALAGAVSAGHGATAAALGVLAGRGVLSACCVRGIPPARAGGLGAAVAGAVPIIPAVLVAIVLASGSVLGPGLSWWQGPAAVLAAYLVSVPVLVRCVHRFGGITGDVLGACVEAGVLGALVVISI